MTLKLQLRERLDVAWASCVRCASGHPCLLVAGAGPEAQTLSCTKSKSGTPGTPVCSVLLFSQPSLQGGWLLARGSPCGWPAVTFQVPFFRRPHWESMTVAPQILTLPHGLLTTRLPCQLQGGLFGRNVRNLPRLALSLTVFQMRFAMATSAWMIAVCRTSLLHDIAGRQPGFSGIWIFPASFSGFNLRSGDISFSATATKS